MKKLLVSSYVFLCIMSTSCMHRGSGLNITYTNSEHYYSMKAYFNKNKTRAVEEYMTSKLGRQSDMSFVNTSIDGTVSLDDNTKFYVVKSPGVLKIKLDKDENSDEAYLQVKAMCEGIKKVVTDN